MHARTKACMHAETRNTDTGPETRWSRLQLLQPHHACLHNANYIGEGAGQEGARCTIVFCGCQRAQVIRRWPEGMIISEAYLCMLLSENYACGVRPLDESAWRTMRSLRCGLLQLLQPNHACTSRVKLEGAGRGRCTVHYLTLVVQCASDSRLG